MLRASTSSAARSQVLGIAAGEDDVGALGAGPPGGFEPDSGAAADQHDGLSEQVRFASRRATLVVAVLTTCSPSARPSA